MLKGGHFCVLLLKVPLLVTYLIITYLLIHQAGIPQFQRKRGYFDLLGFDFMVTAAPENKLVLIEINTNPSLAVGTLFRLCVYNLKL